MYTILRDDKEFFTTVVDCRRAHCSGFSGHPSPKSTIAIGVNYSLLGFPTGKYKSHNKVHEVIPVGDRRPCLCIHSEGVVTVQSPRSKWYKESRYSFIAQAGPTILRNRRERIDVEYEGFKPFKNGAHVAVGITYLGRMVVTIGHTTDLVGLCEELQSHECINGMRVAGGKDLFLKVGNRVFGNESRKIAFGLEL